LIMQVILGLQQPLVEYRPDHPTDTKGLKYPHVIYQSKLWTIVDCNCLLGWEKWDTLSKFAL